MAKIISILQNKGGVGKSTVTCNLAGALSKKYPSKKVLIIDLDAQGNQAISFGKQPDQIENTIYDVLVGTKTIKEAVIPLSDNLDLLASNDDMNYFELDTLATVQETGLQKYLERLKNALQHVLDDYEYIFIDSPPELKVIAAMIIMVTDEIYIPFEPDAYNALGLIRLIEKIEVYKKEYAVKPIIMGVIPMKVKANTLLHRGILTQVDAFCDLNKIRILETKIPYSIKFAEFIATVQMPIVWADPHSKHSKYYYDIVEEVVGHGKRIKETAN